MPKDVGKSIYKILLYYLLSSVLFISVYGITTTSIGNFYKLANETKGREFIVVFNDWKDYSEFMEKYTTKYGIETIHGMKNNISRVPPIALVKLTPQQYDKLLSLKRKGKIVKIFPNRKVRAYLQDTVKLLNATDVWNKLTITGKGSLVCVLDTGIDYTHPDLANNTRLDLSWNYINYSSDPMDDNGHGTHVSGIIAANGTLHGVAPGAKIVAMKVLDKYGSGYEWDIIWALLDCALYKEEGYNISAISMSLGTWDTWSYYCDEEDALAWFVTYVRKEFGIPVVIAAGNSGDTNGLSSPACARGAISVGAIDKNDNIADFSNRGKILDMLSYGVNINSTWLGGRYYVASGTSMAAPHISGIIALLSEVDRNLSANVIEGILKFTAVKYANDTWSGNEWPIPNAYYAVSSLLNTSIVNITENNGKIVCSAPGYTVRLIVTDYWVNKIQMVNVSNNITEITLSVVDNYPAQIFCVAYNNTTPVGIKWVENYVPTLKVKSVSVKQNDDNIDIRVEALTSLPNEVNVSVNSSINLTTFWWDCYNATEEYVPFPGFWWSGIEVNVPKCIVDISLEKPDNITNISVKFSIVNTSIQEGVNISVPVVLTINTSNGLKNITITINPNYDLETPYFYDEVMTNYHLAPDMINCNKNGNSIVCESPLPINMKRIEDREWQWDIVNNVEYYISYDVEIPNIPDYAYYLTEDWENIGIQCIVDPTYKYFNVSNIQFVTYRNGNWSEINVDEYPDVELIGLYASTINGSAILLIKCNKTVFKELELTPGWNLVSGYSMNPKTLVAAWLSGYTKQPVMNFIGVNKVKYYIFTTFGNWSYESGYYVIPLPGFAPFSGYYSEYSQVTPITSKEDLEEFFSIDLWSQYRYPYETLSYWVYIPADVEKWRYIYPALPELGEK